MALYPTGLLYQLAMSDASGTNAPDTSGNANNFTLGLAGSYKPAITALGLQFAQTANAGAGGILVGPQVVARAIVTQQFWLDITPKDNLQLISSNYPAGQQAILTEHDARPTFSIDLYGEPYSGLARPLAAQTVCLSVVNNLNGTASIYIDGNPVDIVWAHASGQAAPNNSTSTAIEFGNNQSNLLHYGYTGTIYYAVGYSGGLTPAQLIQNDQFVRPILVTRGVTFTGLQRPAGKPLLCLVGDSITRGVQSTNDNNYPIQMGQLNYKALSNQYQIVNLGVGGFGTGNLDTVASQWIDPILIDGNGRDVLVVMIGTNDAFSAGALLEQTGFADRRRAAGWWRVILTTGLSRYASDTARQTFNSGLRNPTAPPGWHAVADWGADSIMGQPGAYTSTKYFADNLHPSAPLGYSVGASYLANAVNGLNQLPVTAFK